MPDNLDTSLSLPPDVTEENAKSKLLAGIKALKATHKEEVASAKKGTKKASLEDEDVKTLVDEEHQ